MPVRRAIKYMVAGVILIYGTVTLNTLSWLTQPHHHPPLLHTPAVNWDGQHILHQIELHPKEQQISKPLAGTANKQKISKPLAGTANKQQISTPPAGTANKRNMSSSETSAFPTDKQHRKQTNNSTLNNGSFKQVGNIFVFSAFLDTRIMMDKDLPSIRIMAMTIRNSEENLLCGYTGSSTADWIVAQKYEMCENHDRVYGGYVFNCNIPTDIPQPPSYVYLQTLTNLSNNLSLSIPQSISVEVLPIKPMIIAGLKTSDTEQHYIGKQGEFYERDVYTGRDIDGNYTEVVTGFTANSQNREINLDNWVSASYTGHGEDDYRQQHRGRPQPTNQQSELIGNLNEHHSQSQLNNKQNNKYSTKSIPFSNGRTSRKPVSEFTSENPFQKDFNHINPQNKHDSGDGSRTSDQHNQDIKRSKHSSLVSNLTRNESKFDNTPTDSRDKITYKRANVSIALCVPALHGNVQLSQLIQFIEIYKLLGINQFIIYKMQVSRSVDKLLEFYTRSGDVTVIDWHLPESISTNRLWNNGQIVTIQDCLYRVMGNFDYVAFVDVDEVIIPRLYRDWTAMLRRLETKAILDKPGSITVAFSFQSAFFDPNYSNGSASNLSMLQNLRKSAVLKSVRRKLIVKPDYVTEMGIHHISSTVNGTFHFVVANVDPSVGLVHHYRECTSQLERQVDCRKQRSVDDDTILKYAKPLTQRYFKVLQHNVKKFTKLRVSV